MKKLLFSSALLFIGLFTHAQGCGNLFISEYVEGWSNNKAIEIYNPTPNPIDASPYGLVRFSNGSTDFGSISYLDGITIAAYDVVVVVLEKLDTGGIELEAPVWDELQEVADIYINPSYDNGIWPMYFNGNDAVALLTDDGESLVDMFGRIGEGTDFAGWGPFLDSEGVQSYISQDHTLKRKWNVTQGITTNPAAFNILTEWDSLPANTFDQLGFHLCSCDPNNIPEIAEQQVRIFPNPLGENALSFISDLAMVEIRILTLEGKLIHREMLNDIMHHLELDKSVQGVFIAEVELANGMIFQQRIVR